MPATLKKPLRIVILISGRGSNMQALAEVIANEQLPVQIEAVLSNKANAQGLAWAKSKGIKTIAIEHRNYASRELFDIALMDYLNQINPDYILLAGFMRVLGASFVAKFNGKIINIHPSLLPSFAGLNTHEQALKSGVQAHGCTVHFVTPVLDNGPIIAQGIIPVCNTDTPDILAERLLPLEHTIYCQVLRWLANDKVKLDEHGRVTVTGVTNRAFFDAKLD